MCSKVLHWISNFFFLAGLVEKAFSAGLASAADYKAVWVAFIEYVVRICKWDKQEDVEQVREAFTRATDHLTLSNTNIIELEFVV